MATWELSIPFAIRQPKRDVSNQFGNLFRAGLNLASKQTDVSANNAHHQNDYKDHICNSFNASGAHENAHNCAADVGANLQWS